jgi:hypothetical protein
MTDMNNGRTINGRDKTTGQFVVGHSGLGGRPKGSRNKLGEKFVEDLYAKWRKHGKDVLDRVIKDDPAAFMRTVAQVLPKELDATLNVNVGLFAEVRDFAEAYRLAKAYIGAEQPLIEADIIEDADES